MGFFEKLKQGLSKTASSISSVFTASELDDEFYDDLEERLILADLGMQTTEEAMKSSGRWCASGTSSPSRRQSLPCARCLRA